MNRLLLDPDAPHGTPELLVVTALKKLKQWEGKPVCFIWNDTKRASRQDRRVKSFSFKRSPICYQIAAKIYRLDGLRGFWGKFEPKSEASYVAFNSKGITISGIRALMHAFNASV